MTQAHTNPVALITAASKGIGAGIARELASRGYKVVLLARSHEIHDFAYELGGIGIPGSVTSLGNRVSGAVIQVFCLSCLDPKLPVAQVAVENLYRVGAALKPRRRAG